MKLAQEFIKKDETTITEKEVIDMVDALQKAKAQLVTKESVSKKELKDYIASNELDKLDTNKYLTFTADSFKKALKNAQTLIEQEDATKEQLDEALKQLQYARTQLVLKATDDEVNALKALMDQYQEKDYTVSSWKEFEKVYNDVKAALENENTSDNVQALTNTLKEAAQKLVKRGNLDGIHVLLDQIKQLDSKKYTEASYSKLIDVVTEISKKLENSSEMTQEEVDALVSELQNAINALEKAPTITTDTNEPAHKPQVVTNNKVKTGDSTSAWTFATFALMAAIVYVSLRKRTKED